MPKNRAKKIVRQYAGVLREAGVPFSAIYLFGSHAQKRAHRGSDIDVAIIFDRFANNAERSRLLLWKLRRGVDARIEPQGLTVQRFKSAVDPVAHEIRTTGIRVA